MPQVTGSRQGCHVNSLERGTQIEYCSIKTKTQTDDPTHAVPDTEKVETYVDHVRDYTSTTSRL